jgi:hypothetical protein
MPQSGLWRKKLLTIKFCDARQWQDIRLPPTSETGLRRVVDFSLISRNSLSP